MCDNSVAMERIPAGARLVGPKGDSQKEIRSDFLFVMIVGSLDEIRSDFLFVKFMEVLNEIRMDHRYVMLQGYLK